MRGKKTDNATIYKIMVNCFITNNCSETARQLGIPENTVNKIFNENKNKEEFKKLWELKSDEFVEKADRIINKSINILERRLKTAEESQDELEDLIDKIWDVDWDEMGYTERQKLVGKIREIQINKLSELTTVIGTMTDKKRLVQNKSTENVKVSYEETLKKVAEMDEF